jgi:hypothetical protein
MPTGYTAGILDGKTKTFKEYAMNCARNFGATMHMRDKPFDAPYEAPEPSDYHPKRIAETNELLLSLEKLSDQDIISRERADLLKSKDAYEKGRKETEENSLKLKAFLEEAINFNPPTKEHEDLSNFMCKQLHDTINFDGSTRFYDEKLVEIDTQLKTLNAEDIRNENRIRAYKDLSYHTENYQKELKRCHESKKWMDDLLGAL